MNQLTYEMELVEMSKKWIDYVRQNVDFFVPELEVVPVFGSKFGNMNADYCVLGEYSFGYIYLYFGDIMRFTEEHYYSDMTRLVILEVITHEIHHIDQVLDHQRYNNDNEYRFLVEYPVICSTTKFMRDHMNTLYDITGVDIERMDLFINSAKNNYYGIKIDNIDRFNRDTQLKNIYLQTLAVRLTLDGFMLNIFDTVPNIDLTVIYTYDATDEECLNGTMPVTFCKGSFIKKNGKFLTPDRDINEMMVYLSGENSVENPLYACYWLIAYQFSDDESSISINFYKIRRSDEDRNACGFMVNNKGEVR